MDWWQSFPRRQGEVCWGVSQDAFPCGILQSISGYLLNKDLDLWHGDPRWRMWHRGSMTSGYQLSKSADFWCMSSLCRTPQTGKPSEKDHVPLLPEASLLFHEGTQRLLTRKGILVLEADKLLLQVVMLWSFKGTQLHHFHCSLHGIKVKHTYTYISLYRPCCFFTSIPSHRI